MHISLFACDRILSILFLTVSDENYTERFTAFNAVFYGVSTAEKNTTLSSAEHP